MCFFAFFFELFLPVITELGTKLILVSIHGFGSSTNRPRRFSRLTKLCLFRQPLFRAEFASSASPATLINRIKERAPDERK